MKKYILFTFILALFSLTVSAQGRPVRDKDKENVIRSTERGHWNFSPDWYMYLFHKDYSGGYTKWEWHGLHSGLRVHFKESKSKTKTVGPRREAALIADALKDSVIEIERQKIEDLKDQEVAKAADRNVDLVYPKYKEQFMDMQKVITKCLTYSIRRSKGKLASIAKDISDRNEIVTATIAYLHKTGIGYELENAKREEGYYNAKKEMEKVMRSARKLAKMAMAYY